MYKTIRYESYSRCFTWFMALLFSTLLLGCGGDNGKSPILGGMMIAPTVSALSPFAGAINVPANTVIISAAFSEPMDVSTITTANMGLVCPSGTVIAGSVAYVASGNVATFTPASSLPSNTLCTVTITTGVKDVAGNAMVNPFSWSFTTGATPDTTAPTISSVMPTANATGVAFNSLVTVSFSEAMNPLTITTANFSLACPAGNAITGTVGYAVSGNVATFTPSANLPASTICTATVTTGVQDAAGNALASAYSWNFTTGAAPDITAPTVSSVTPLANATGVAINSLVTVSFSEAINPLTITTANFSLACPTGTAITGTVGYAVLGNVATFTPAANLPASTICTATVTTGVRDVAGNALTSAYSWNFTTGAAPDTTAPTVSTVSPLANATGVAINSLITVSFSEPMNPLTITAANVSLACPTGTAITGTVGYAVSGNVATFTPSANLPASTICTATVTTGVRDTAGNALASAYSWNFTTGAAPDITAPTVSSVTPLANATGVAINSHVTVSFSEAINPLTITTANFSLACPTGTAITGTVGYAVSGNVATFTPSANLPASTICTATVTTGVRDVAGNALASTYNWNFTTGAAPDTTPPTVITVTPLANATGVAVNSLVTASFSEAMNPLTITTANFSLACPTGTAITGTVGYAVSGNVATFTPAANLPASTICTATVSTGVRDTAGNALASTYSWSFTTGALPDTTPPTVITVTPVANATGVAINSLVTASFSEAMNPLTITTANFSLACPTGTAITGTVGYAVIGNVATFTPSANLPASTICTATITTGVRDAAGNALASTYNWNFTTGALPDTTPPTVITTDPPANVTGVCSNKLITATFSEAMDPLTITAANFGIAGVTGTVAYNAVGNIATFTPSALLAASTLYTATVKTAVKDTAGNSLAVDKVWSFTTGSASCAAAVSLGAAAPFAGFGGGAGMTNQGTLTIITGDIGSTAVSTAITGFHDSVGDVYTETTLNMGAVTGRIYTAPPAPGGAGVGGTAPTFVIATAAASDAQIAYNALSPASMPGGIDPGAGQLGGLTLAPGIYKAAGGTFLLTGSDLVLDAQGDVNAVWVFQTAAGLTIGAPAFPRNITLINGAQAKNVFWYVGSAARVEDRSNMVGTIIASAGVTISTAGQLSTTTLNGRALGLNASVTIVNTVINIPAP